MTELNPLCIISWNVASLKTLVTTIHARHTKHENGNEFASFKSKEEAMNSYLTDLNADIICLQEIKMKKEDIVAKANEIGCRHSQYDVFFAIPNPSKSGLPSPKSKDDPVTARTLQRSGGLNGVATFVKKGMTTSASCTILGDPLYDYEGRCLLTVHGSLAVFNVYVPNSGEGGKSLQYKKRFVQLLHAAMTLQKAQGRHVVLCGDLNICYRGVDCHPLSHRQLDVAKLIAAIKNTNAAEAKGSAETALNMRSLLLDALDASGFFLLHSPTASSPTGSDHRDHIVNRFTELLSPVLQAIEAQWITLQAALIDEFVKVSKLSRAVTSSSGDSSTSLRFAASVAADAIEANQLLGKVEYEILVKCVRRVGISTTSVVSHCTTQSINGQIRVAELDPNIPTPAGASAPHVNPQDIERLDLLWLLYELLGESSWEEESVSWLRRLLGESDKPYFWENDDANTSIPSASEPSALPHLSSSLRLIDPLAGNASTSRGSFTIWNQQTNSRYTNQGSRIDFTLVDSSLLDHLCDKGPNETESVVSTENSSLANDVGPVCTIKRLYQQSLVAVTHNGAFKPATAASEGIPPASHPGIYRAHLSTLSSVASAPWWRTLNGTRAGTIITPPEYSDHIPVCVVLRNTLPTSDGQVTQLVPSGQVLSSDAATKQCMPHRQQSMITGFFKTGPPAAADDPDNKKAKH